MTEQPARRTGNAKRTKHLDEPQPPAVRRGHGGQNSGNPIGLRRSRNDEDLLLRRITALELRVRGYGYREISVELGVSVPVAFHDVKRMLREREAEAVAEARTLEETRLDKILHRAMEVVNSTTSLELRLKAIDRVVRVINQRSLLLGLNMPAQVNVSVTELSQADVELAELLAEAEARNAATLAQINDPGPSN